MILFQKRPVIILQNIALHISPCNEQANLCNDQWAKTMLGNGTEQSYIDAMRSTGTTWIMVIMLAGTVIAAAVSAFAGCKMLRKQFEKAGIAK